MHNILQYLNEGANVNRTIFNLNRSLLHWAVNNGQFEIAELLIMRGADINLQDGNLDTPLNIAAMRESLEGVRLLLQHKANPDIENWADETPLFTAVKFKRIENVKLLLEHGARLTQDKLTEILSENYYIPPKLKKLIKEAHPSYKSCIVQ